MSPKLSSTGIILEPGSTESGEVVGTIDLPWFGKQYAVEVIFENDNDDVPNTLQIQSFCDLIARWDEFLEELTQHVLKNWKSELEEHSQTQLYDATRPPAQQVGENTTLTGIVIASMDGEDWCNYIGVLAECSWAPEHGLGVKIVDGSIVAIGHQDLVS